MSRFSHSTRGRDVRRAFAFSLFFAAPAFAADAPPGGRLFLNQCARCHQADAAGSARLAASLGIPVSRLNLIDEDTVAKDNAALLKTIRTGTKTGMPSFSPLLTAEAQANLVAHLRLLQARARETAVPSPAPGADALPDAIDTPSEPTPAP
jgi:mono/diheme cytochrome c family protein